MRITLSPPWIKTLSGLFVNLSAAWFATIFIIPAFSQRSDWLFVLTVNLMYGIVYLLLSVKLEELLENES